MFTDSMLCFTGQQCLPGGNREDGDAAPIDTALREASEEVGLDAGLVEPVSVLPAVCSGWDTLTCVTPVVCFLKCQVEEVNLICNPHEVQAISWVPLRIFVSSRSAKLSELLWRDIPTTLVVFDYVNPATEINCHIWGLTSCICVSASAIALDRAPAFPNPARFCVFDVVLNSDGSVTAVSQSIALTSDEIEKWRDHPKLKSRLSIRQWHDALTKSKL